MVEHDPNDPGFWTPWWRCACGASTNAPDAGVGVCSLATPKYGPHVWSKQEALVIVGTAIEPIAVGQVVELSTCGRYVRPARGSQHKGDGNGG